MSNDADAFLYYGFDLDEEDAGRVCGDEEWEHIYAATHGIHEPSKEPDSWDNDDDPITQTWSEYWAMVRECIAKCPCEIEFWGSDQEQIYFISVKEATYRTDWSNSKPINWLGTKVEWQDQIRKFCGRMKIEVPPSIGWRLAARWF